MRSQVPLYAFCHSVFRIELNSNAINRDELFLECPEGYFGTNCVFTCSCQNDGVCNHMNGACQCQPGFTGNK